MRNFAGFIILFIVSFVNSTFAQTDSVQIDCDDFERRLETAFSNKRTSYEQYELLVLNTLSNGAKKTIKRENILATLSKSNQVEYNFEADKFESVNSNLFYRGYSDQFSPVFELTEYDSDYMGDFWFWSMSWEYLTYHTIDIKSYASVVQEFDDKEYINMNLVCNQKAFVIMLGLIIDDQTNSKKRTNFYTKSEPVLVNFFKSAGVDLAAFEKDFLEYLHEYEFTDSTIENQYFAYHFHTCDLEFMPLPQGTKLRNRMREYHTKLFSQDAFFIDTSKIIPRPQSWDSLSLMRDIMRAYPDSIMFAPGKSPFELELEKLIKQEDLEDNWFLSIYAGVFKIDNKDIHDEIIRYSPIDFRSSSFRKWYALFVLQEMFNRENIKPGVREIQNRYRLYPNYDEKINNYFTVFLLNDINMKTGIIRPQYSSSSEQIFNSENYQFEIFDNDLFKDEIEAFRIQLKLDPDGNFIKDATIIDPPMSAAREKLLTDALSKYKFHPFLVRRPDSTGYGWIQIVCKRKLKGEENSGWDVWGDFSMDLEDVSDDMVIDMEEDQEEIFSFTETEAQFMHGEEGLKKYIAKRMPAEFETTERGTVYVRMVVNKDGSLEGFRVIKGVNDELDEIASDIAVAMPNWIPAEMEKKPVRSYVTLVIEFE